MKRMRILLAALGAFALLATACTSKSSPSASGSGGHTPVTITVWDYYGTSTPMQPQVIQGFEKQYPWVTVDYQEIGWTAEQNKFTVVVSSGAPPDVATMDMTWMPTFASNGLFTDLGKLSGGQLNGKPITDQYAQGAVEAMQYNDTYVTMLFDFDVYALYYRSDLFKQAGVQVPTNWTEMQAAAAKIAQDTNGDGTCDKYCVSISGNDTFHFSQPLFQSGGAILNTDNTSAAFNSPQGLSAMNYMKSFLDDGSGYLWTTAQGDTIISGIKDERLAMFQDGPYYMGLLKDGVPEQKGKWAVAVAPYSQQPGSYLGGTGLSIPVNAKHPQEAWLFVEYMLEPQQQVGVFTYAGAAPATTAALEAPELAKPDPYFGGEAPFGVFLKALDTATHFPYVAQWDAIDQDIGNMVESVMLNKATAQQALSDGAAKVNQELQSG